MEQTVFKESTTMPATAANTDIDEILREVGPDSTAMFDSSASNPTEHASSEDLRAAAADDVDDIDEDDDEDDEDEDDLDDDDDLDEDDEDDEDDEVEDDDEDEDLDDEDEDEDEDDV